MTMTTQQRAAMLADLNAEQFAPLDLSQFVDFQEPPAPETHDGRFSRHWTDTPLNASATALRQFVTDPPLDVLSRVGEETGNTDFRAEVRDRRGEAVAGSFKRANPEYLPTDKNYNLILRTLAFNALPNADGDLRDIQADLIDAGYWTVTNLTATYRALSGEGLLEVAAGTARQLSSSERLRVTRLAQSGRVDAAIGEYLNCALDGDGAELGMELLNDPAYTDVCNAACYAVFEDTQLDYSATPERKDYLLRYADSRPLTLPLLQQAWRSCQANEQRHERGELLTAYQRPEEAAPPTERELDALSDEGVENLYRASLREYARSIKGPGVLA
jgi:hypothetical protein